MPKSPATEVGTLMAVLHFPSSGCKRLNQGVLSGLSENTFSEVSWEDAENLITESFNQSQGGWFISSSLAD